MSKAAMNVSIKSDMGYFAQLMKSWPGIKKGLLSEIGYVGRKTLQYNFLSGQVIDLRAYPYGKDQKRRTVSYSITKGMRGVKISAYPLNLYNPEAVYSSAAGMVQAAAEQALASYDSKILQDRLDKLTGGKA